MALMNAWSQWFPSSPPPFTEKDLPRQDGKVFIVTGGNSGLGFELSQILYNAGGTVYVTTRNEQKGEDTVRAIREGKTATASGGNSTDGPAGHGQVRYLVLDLNDLTTIHGAVEAFTKQETKLDVLWNNAGISNVPAGTMTAQNIEQHLGVNCVGPLLFTRLLLPQLRHAAAGGSPPGSVRVVWTSSWMSDNQAPQGGIAFDELPHGSSDPQRNYGTSKCGNWLLAAEGARRWGPEGIVSVVQNPGNVKSNVWRHTPNTIMFFMNLFLYPTMLGVYTELYAGLSSDITIERNGCYIIPWGRIQETTARPDIVQAMKTEQDGGTDVARHFWDFCKKLAAHYEQ